MSVKAHAGSMQLLMCPRQTPIKIISDTQNNFQNSSDQILNKEHVENEINSFKCIKKEKQKKGKSHSPPMANILHSICY